MRALLLAVGLMLGGGCATQGPEPAGPATEFGAGAPASEVDIRAEVRRMAVDWLAMERMKGFPHRMSLDEAYAWQDEFVVFLEPSQGTVVGYKTGGHDSGPGFPIFPPEGIRAQILAGQMRPDGTEIRVEDTRAGFLEADFAFRVGSGAINYAQTDLEILAALDAIVPFAEVPDPWYEQGTRTVNGTIVANMSTRFSFTGEPVPIGASQDWLQRIRHFTFTVTDEHGEVVQAGGIDGWYDPIAVVRWLRDQLLATGHRLYAGQLLSLGNIGIIRQLHEGSPRGPAYTRDRFLLEYHGLVDGPPPSVTINVAR